MYLGRPQYELACHLPREHHHKVHDIPSIPQVRVLVEGEAQSQDLDPGFKTEDPNEIHLGSILRTERTRRPG